MTRGTYQEIRELSNEVSRGLGSVAIFTIVAFCIYNWFAGDVSLGLLWIPFLFVAIIVATLAIGAPVLLLRAAIEIRRPTIGHGGFLALKFVFALWFLASFILAWLIAAALANWMN